MSKTYVAAALAAVVIKYLLRLQSNYIKFTRPGVKTTTPIPQEEAKEGTKENRKEKE
jgi:hypothetical protein